MVNERLDRDAYFTPKKVSEEIIEDLLNAMRSVRGMNFIEPSAGSGSFMYALEKHGEKVKGYDICPLREDIIKHDFLKENLNLKNKFIIGNPPYGVRHKLALDFINNHFNKEQNMLGFY